MGVGGRHSLADLEIPNSLLQIRVFVYARCAHNLSLFWGHVGRIFFLSLLVLVFSFRLFVSSLVLFSLSTLARGRRGLVYLVYWLGDDSSCQPITNEDRVMDIYSLVVVIIVNEKGSEHLLLALATLVDSSQEESPSA